MQANRGGEASTSRSAPSRQQPAAPEAHLQNGTQSHAARKGAAVEEDPAWLALPAVHYPLMQGNQQPSFRLAGTRHWLAWEVRTEAICSLRYKGHGRENFLLASLDSVLHRMKEGLPGDMVWPASTLLAH